MAVSAIIECKGATLDQYDPVLAKMGARLAAVGRRAACSETEDGIRVTDVWHTREELETFAAEQIGPLSAEAGFLAPPEITFHDVHVAADERAVVGRRGPAQR